MVLPFTFNSASKVMLFIKEPILLPPILCFLYRISDFGCQPFSVSSTGFRISVAHYWRDKTMGHCFHFFRSVDNKWFEERDKTTGTSSCQHVWLKGPASLSEITLPVYVTHALPCSFFFIVISSTNISWCYRQKRRVSKYHRV